MIFENPELFESKSIRPHYLSFQDISEAKINLLLQREGIKEILSEVSVVNLKIKNSQDINDLALNRLLKQLPKLCLAMSPTGEIADKITKAFPELLVEIDYNHLHKSHLQNQEALNQALNKLNFSTGDKPKLSLVKGSASGTERDLIKSGDDGKTVLYPEDCGNALNCPNPPYIRISQGIFPNIGKNFNEDFCYDEAFLNEQKSLTEYQVLSQQIIDRLTTQTNQTDPNYYLINVVVPSKDCYYRLLSIADGEEIAYIKTEPETKIEIKKGEDGFFYIKSDSNQTPLAVSYILKSSKSLEADANNDLAKIKDEDLVSEEFGGINILQIGKEVIQKYRDGRPFSGVPSLDSLNDLENSYKESKHKEWLENLFNQKAGVCRHKVVAVYSTIYQELLTTYKKNNPSKTGDDATQEVMSVLKKNIRTIYVNDSHILLEIKHRDKWVKLEPSGLYTAAGTDIRQRLAKLNLLLQKQTSTRKYLPTLSDLAKEGGIETELSLTTMAQTLLAITNLPEITTIQDLKSNTINNANNKILIVTNSAENTENHANFLLREARKLKRKIFYINSPAQIDLHRTNLLIANDNNPALTSEGLLSHFLNPSEVEESNKQNKPLLIINWSAFNNKDRLALNTVLDRDRKINGVKIDDSIQIIGLSNFTSQDPSFLSRHNTGIQSTTNLSTSEALIASKAKTIDLQGFPNWRRHLFGKVTLQGEKMVWQKSDFVKEIEAVLEKKDEEETKESEPATRENEAINFQIKNLSPEAAQELNHEFKQAKAVGKFIYHGYEINLPELSKITCDTNGFNFTKFSDKSQILVTKNTTLDKLPKGYSLINTNLFDLVLCDKKIDDGTYIEEKGLIDNCPETDGKKTLKLFITSNLSESQWYCLFNESQSKGVILDIALAPEISLPDNVKTTDQALAKILESELKTKPWAVVDIEDFNYQDLIESATSKTNIGGFKSFEKDNSRIFVSNDANQLENQLRLEGVDILMAIFGLEEPKTKPFAVVDIEDFNYQDLIESITFTTDTDGFKNFEKKESQFLEKLKSGEKIILKGKFSADLLQMLEPLLIGQEPDFSQAGKNLTLIIEDKECQEGVIYEPLKWLPKEGGYQVQTYQKTYALSTATLYAEIADTSTDLTNSQEKSDQFINSRKTNFSETLDQHSMLRLIGHSGVGKSRLLKMLEEAGQEQEVNGQEKTTEVYRELNAFEGWATNKSLQIKILFIDESNIEDLHFTMFSMLKNPLKKDETHRIFYQGKFYDLDHNHKVVFAQNPVEYGGGRFEQKLFDDGIVPAISLKDFPASYIYEKILKESIYEKLGNEVRKQVDEETFKQICQPLIEHYQETNSKKSSEQDANEITVRELQESILVELINQIGVSKQPAISSANFISTDATKAVEKALGNSLEIRNQQRLKNFPNKAIGLNGILLEGDSGTGKSELIGAMLKSRGIV